MGKTPPKTLSEAIEQLDQVSKPYLDRKLEDLKALLEELSPFLDEAKQFASDTTSAAVKKSVEQAKKTSKEIDEAVHDKPWIAVTVVGILALVVGFLLGSRRK